MNKKLWYLLCATIGALLLSGPMQASAAPSTPALFDEIAESEVPLSLAATKDVAVDRKSGAMYVTIGNEVEKLSPYGAFVLAFGREVDETKVARRKQEQAKSETVTVTAQEEDICTAASGDTCSESGASGAGAGMLSKAAGVAVEQVSGDVFVVDNFNRRVEKFNSSGQFLLAFGFDVNKVKTAALASPPSAAEQKAADLCVAGEECQAGVASSAEGAFESPAERPGFGEAQAIATAGAEGSERVYVGDKARIEAFASSGEFVEQLSLSSISATEKVTTLAGSSAGEVFFAYDGVTGVHEAVTNGSGALELSGAVFDGSSKNVEAIGVSNANLYVADSSPSLRMLDYEVANPSEAPAEFAGSELTFPLEVEPITINSLGVEAHGVNGVAVNGAGSVAVAVHAPIIYHGPHTNSWPTGYHGSVKLYGALAAMESSYGAPPAVKPAIDDAAVKAGVEASTATLEARINPELRATRYQFEYGVEPCSAGNCVKTPASLTSLGSTVKSEHAVLATLSGLEAGRTYRYRVIAENSVGTSESAERVFRIGVGQQPGAAVGLPDGRIYEEVSPVNKYGGYVESWHAKAAFVSPSGESVMYTGGGALSEDATNAGSYPLFVSQRTAKGWVTRSSMPQTHIGVKEPEEYVTLETEPSWVVPSSDLSRLLFTTVKNAPYVGPPDALNLWNNLYLEGSDPSVEPEWIGRSQIEGEPGGIEDGEGEKVEGFTVAGASPDLETVYFYYYAKLFPEASRLYEYRDGVLSDAGALPGGEKSSGPATPAAQTDFNGGYRPRATPTSAAGFDNEVSANGSRIFFVRMDEAGTLELYVHITEADGAQATELVSQSQLAGHEGEAAAQGAYPMPSTAPQPLNGEWPEHGPTESPPSYVFASPDGSHAFFQSVSRLTEDAPANDAVKTYDFDLETGELEYLPAITGSIASVAEDGSSLIFENTASEPFTLERWVAGPGGGTVTSIADLPPVSLNGCGPVLCVGPVYTSTDGSVITFATEAPIPGFNDGGTHVQLYHVLGLETPQPEEGAWPNSEIFRYEASSGELNCVSCPPKGQTPISNAIMSKLAFEDDAATEYENNKTEFVANDGRGMNADGSEVFFETQNALVPQDTNGLGDVYEWESGKVSLISGGKEAKRSVLLGVSESGNDAFFATAEGIAAGDTDGAYDVYDAHVPQPGEKPVEALPCEGAVCQGPPSVPNLLGQPASEAFSGPGNLTPTSPAKQSQRSNGHKGKQKKGLKKKKRRKAQQRKRRSQRTGKRHHNGRGK
ncbi:MAG TPA: hypothetical protein VGF95_00145 [Solirubrobacteraceae bacterium]|jgi:hypothetical protein